MATFKNLIFVAILATLLAIGLVKSGLITSAPAQSTETAYHRILRTNTIRCGYSVWKPFMWVDPTTGKKMGIFPDLIEEAGKRLGLKVVWQEEVGWGSLAEALRSGRIDMACAGYWLDSTRIKYLLPTVPQLYSPTYIYVRAADAHKFATPEALNSSRYTVATIDGGGAEKRVIAQHFPRSKQLTLPELSGAADEMEDLATGKADFVIQDPPTAELYETHNPGKIVSAFPNTPMDFFPTVMLMPPDDVMLKSMIDNTLLGIEHDGTLDAILKKYHATHLVLRNPQPVAPPQ
ncbi:MAG: amino acid ABC transporter substrate-binding protein [Alphaproteobacteria bacterium]|nr:amino acid ABC transporter substrate-binding protein [Alphaproteobacteria bacterium]